MLYFNNLPPSPSPPLFFLLLCFQDISNGKSGSIKWETNIVLITTLVLQDQPQEYIFSYFYKLLRTLSFYPEWVLNFLSSLYILPYLGKSFKFLVFLSLEKVFNLGIFLMPPSLVKALPQVLIINPPGTGELVDPPSSIFSKIYSPQQLKGMKKTMICFIKIQIENMRMTWNIRLFIFCMIRSFFKCDGFTVL